MKRLRKYQKKQHQIVVAHLSNPNSSIRAQIYAPTGSGKTENFLRVVDELRTILKPTQPLKIGIVHPRLALSMDQLRRFKLEFGVRFNSTSFHSGKHLSGEESLREISTTKVNDLQLIHDNTIRDHVTFISYKSLHKLKHIKFDLLICDEAHNLVPSSSLDEEDDRERESKVETLRGLAARKILFYTATPINDVLEGEGMNNADMFGPIISATTPKELIPLGYVVGPIVQELRVITNQVGRDGIDTTDIVAESFIRQRDTMAQYGLNTIQMLVTSRGYKDHRKLQEELIQLWERVGRNVKLYIIEAQHAYCGERRMESRYEALEAIKQNGLDGISCIIVHFDTLAEGIDISSITGVCMLRGLRPNKIIQTMGRAGRPHHSDINAMGEVINMKKRVKPFSILTLPVIDGQHIGGASTESIAEAFHVGGYGELSELIDRDNVTRAVGNTSNGDDDPGDPIESFFSQAISISERTTFEQWQADGIIMF